MLSNELQQRMNQLSFKEEEQEQKKMEEVEEEEEEEEEDDFEVAPPDDGQPIDENKIDNLVEEVSKAHELKEELKKLSKNNTTKLKPVKEQLKETEQHLIQMFLETKVPHVNYRDYRFQVDQKDKLGSFTRKTVEATLKDLYGEKKGTDIYNNINEYIGRTDAEYVMVKKKISRKRKRNKN
jgi:hypothetical protein